MVKLKSEITACMGEQGEIKLVVLVVNIASSCSLKFYCKELTLG